jgi:amino acid adenylation domain-containing protein/thioester reductase-like protein
MNATPDPRSFLEVFASAVDKHRKKNAIVTEGTHKVTYGQLFSKACRVAHLLKVSGIREGEPVGIGISKSADYIACLLGTWIAGAAFVPVDPVLPKERAQFIINQSAMRFILVRETGGNAFSSLGVKPLKVDGNWNDDSSFQNISKETLQPPADRLAYIIYTSGSTGRPKGVMVTHAGIWNFLNAQIKAFKFNEKSNSLFVLSTNFDASVSDIGCALLAGSTLFVEPPGLLSPGPHFLDLLKERNITHMDVPPSLLKTIPSDQPPSSLQTIIIGGEACAPDVVRTWASKCLVVNVYGPTEATVCTSLGACDSKTWERPLIGQPLANVDYFILDENQKPVAQGCPGELYIGGVQLAKGYVDEPELTARKFVEIDGMRLYRTGDLILRCEDGEYQFLGRVDRQFKLRGMLVEPEEIEAKLAAHDDIARAGVLKRPLRPGLSGDKLVAFVQPHQGKTLDSNQLKQFLSKSLPLWMVPQLFETVEQMPLTVTGKVDLSLLRETPLKAAPVLISAEAATDTQKILVEVWKQIFGLEAAGIHDDFYDLGGDSLNVIEAVLATHLRGLTLSPDMLVAHSTISDLSQAIDRQATGETNGSSESANALSSDFLRQDIQLDSSMRALMQNDRRTDHVNSSILKNIFLTGTTGFLGARLLAELLNRTDATMHCLVRAGSHEAALTRIEHAVQIHGTTLSAKERQRIVPVLGDLTAKHLGITDDKWRQLTATIDTVFHSAATVNMVKDYFELRPANVCGTKEIVRFTLEGRRKHLHYASTLSVFVATTRNTGIAREDDFLDQSFQAFGGYAQTKVAAELLLRSISQNACSISFYRFGLLTGDSHSGRSAKDDFLNMFARGISTLGCVPESNSNMAVDITPVDYAAAAMAHIAVKDTKLGVSNTYHIANEHSLSFTELLVVMHKLGCKLDVLPPGQFLSRLQSKEQKFNSEESAACLALCRALGNNESFAQFRTMDLFQATGISFDSANTRSALKGTAIACPEPSKELIELYLRQVLKIADAF